MNNLNENEKNVINIVEKKTGVKLLQKEENILIFENINDETLDQIRNLLKNNPMICSIDYEKYYYDSYERENKEHICIILHHFCEQNHKNICSYCCKCC